MITKAQSSFVTTISSTLQEVIDQLELLQLVERDLLKELEGNRNKQKDLRTEIIATEYDIQIGDIVVFKTSHTKEKKRGKVYKLGPKWVHMNPIDGSKAVYRLYKNVRKVKK